jgi:hypothetical protein
MALGTVLIAAILLGGPLYKLYWLITTRSHPRTQETAPDLSAFQRGTGHKVTGSNTRSGRDALEYGAVDAEFIDPLDRVRAQVSRQDSGRR